MEHYEYLVDTTHYRPPPPTFIDSCTRMLILGTYTSLHTFCPPPPHTVPQGGLSTNHTLHELRLWGNNFGQGVSTCSALVVVSTLLSLPLLVLFLLLLLSLYRVDINREWTQSLSSSFSSHLSSSSSSLSSSSSGGGSVPQTLQVRTKNVV
jgi:hypothetical protein